MRNQTNNKQNKLTSEQIYNHSAIRFTAVVFGSVFSNFKSRLFGTDGTIRSDKVYTVPISYAAKNNYAIWLEQQMRLPNGNLEISNQFPRFSFEMVGLSFDESRVMNMSIPIYGKTVSASGKTLSSRTPIAYNFDYTLDLWCKQMDDSIEILDQMLPMFTPNLTLKVRESNKVGIVNDISIQLNSISKNDTYMDGFSEQRLLDWTFDFTLSADIIPNATEESAIIQKVILDTVERETEQYVDGHDPSFFSRYGVETHEQKESETVRPY